MWRTLGISKFDWQQTPPAVQTKLLSECLQSHSLKLRAISHQKQIDSLNQPAAQIKCLNAKIIKQQKQIDSLQKQLAKTNQLAAEVAKLSAEVAELKEKLGQNSRNSSHPPSSDSPFRKLVNRREPSGLKAGAQTGHKGVGCALKPIEEVDCLIELRSDTCSACGSLLLGDDLNPARRQVVEITAAGVSLIEYRRHSLCCLSCKKLNRAAWSETAKRGAFGEKVVAVIGYLTGRLGISQRDAVEAMQELFTVKIGLGSISALQRRLSEALAEPVAAIDNLVQQQPVCGVDETSWREKDSQPWLWIVTTEQATVFRILPSRGKSEAHKVIGQSVSGIVTTDRYPGYGWLPLHHRQICWAHLKRDFQAIAERTGDSQAIGESLLEQSKELFKLWRRVRDGPIEKAEFQSSIEPIQKRIKELLLEGTTSTHSKTRNTCRNILKLEYALWTFTRIEGVEPTNNRAERALRRAVLWRRRSFGTQSETGSRFVERILTVVTTLRQQGRSVLDYLNKACAAETTIELNLQAV